MDDGEPVDTRATLDDDGTEAMVESAGCRD